MSFSPQLFYLKKLRNPISLRATVFRLFILTCALYFVSTFNYNWQNRKYDNRNELYYLPDLLNVSGIVNNSLVVTPYVTKIILQMYPKSFSAFYFNFRKRCVLSVDRHDLQNALESYGSMYDLSTKSPVHLSTNSKTLVIQVSKNSPQDLNSLVVRIKELSVPYESLLVICDTVTEQTDLKQLLSLINKTINFFVTDGIVVREDLAIHLMYKAKNLLVDGGSAGALAALISSSENGVYLSSGLQSYLNQNEFRHSVQVRDDTKNPTLNLVGNAVPSCCQFSTYGSGDSAKVFCNNAKNYMTEPCWVLSIGCKNQWGFEAEIFQRTNCMIQVFDCTGDFQVPASIQSRVKLHKLCIGIEGDKRVNYKPWSEVIDIGSTNSGLALGVAPTVAKMDVEGWEFPVLTAMGQNIHDTSKLPKQLEFELHVLTYIPIGYPWEKIARNRFKISDGGIRSLLSNLSYMGYELVHRADNPYCKHCSEVTFLHRTAFPAHRH